MDERYPYFITSSVINGYNLFNKKQFRGFIIDGLNFMSDERGMLIYAYVIMPNHIHLITKGENLSKCIASLKSYTARQIIDSIKKEGNVDWLSRLTEVRVNTRIDRDYQLWTEGFHPKQIFSEKVMEQKINYMHYNPVKAGLVQNASDWEYSSYGDYYGKSSGYVEIFVYKG